MVLKKLNCEDCTYNLGCNDKGHNIEGCVRLTVNLSITDYKLIKRLLKGVNDDESKVVHRALYSYYCRFIRKQANDDTNDMLENILVCLANELLRKMKPGVNYKHFKLLSNSHLDARRFSIVIMYLEEAKKIEIWDSSGKRIYKIKRGCKYAKTKIA